MNMYVCVTMKRGVLLRTILSIGHAINVCAAYSGQLLVSGWITLLDLKVLRSESNSGVSYG